MQNNQINENLEYGDLKRLVGTEIHIDEYKSKMGDDADVCVLSYKVSGKEPAADMVAFIEKGYDFVLDADVSSGEKEGGDYLVFVELQRIADLPNQIMQMINDILNLTEQSLEEWKFKYRRESTLHQLTEENLKMIIPLSAEQYRLKFHDEQNKIDQLKTAAGIDVNTKAPDNEYTESLRIAAGIR